MVGKTLGAKHKLNSFFCSKLLPELELEIVDGLLVPLGKAILPHHPAFS